MELIKNILKGMVVGLANIIPGVSGGTLMVSMNIYDKLIHSITHLFKELKESVLFLLPIFIGMGIAIVGSSFGLEYLFDNFPVQTNLLFIGLILGGLPIMLKNIKGGKTVPGNIVAFVIFFAIVVGLALMGGKTGGEATLSVSFGGIIMLFIIGIISAATMVVPGVSGSMILLILGYYHPIVSAISDFFRALKAMDISGLIFGFEILVPFGLGVVFGIFSIAKLIDIVFEKYPMYAYWAIIGLIVASPFAIIIMNLTAFAAGLSVLSAITGLVACAAGVAIAVKLGE